MNSTTSPPEPAPRPRGKPWTFTEAAEHLGVSTKHIRAMADRDKIATIRVGKRARRISDAEMGRICKEGI